MRSRDVVLKRVGETPLQALEAYRRQKPDLKDAPLTYAGRLDPMASGKLLILAGDECKRKARYLKLQKEYVFEILAGIESDTGDVLGLPHTTQIKVPTEQEFIDAAQTFVGDLSLPYPGFSSKTVSGKPLFQHALEKNLHNVKIPHGQVRVYRMKFLGREEFESKKLLDYIEGRLDSLDIDPHTERLGADFRREEIRAAWRRTLAVPRTYAVAKFKATVSSGTYIRVLAPLIAQRLGTSGLALSIHRSKIGTFVPLGKRRGFWLRSY